jgi:hypothetical protein
MDTLRQNLYLIKHGLDTKIKNLFINEQSFLLEAVATGILKTWDAAEEYFAGEFLEYSSVLYKVLFDTRNGENPINTPTKFQSLTGGAGAGWTTFGNALTDNNGVIGSLNNFDFSIMHNNDRKIKFYSDRFEPVSSYSIGTSVAPFFSVHSNELYSHNLDTNGIVYIDSNKKLSTEASFTYNAGTDTLNVTNIAISGGITIPGLTQGSVLFAISANTIGQNNTNFFWNNITQNLILGNTTSSGFGKLTINADGFSEASITLTRSASTFEIVNDGNLFIRRSGSARLYMDATSFNVGIGTGTSATARFNVWGSGSSSSSWTAQFHGSSGTSNNVMMRDDGNNGFGTSSPSGMIDISSSTPSKVLFQLTRPDTTKGLRFVNYTGAGSFNLEYSNNLSSWSTFASFNIIFGGANPALGIGTATPFSDLTVFSSTTAAIVSVGRSTASITADIGSYSFINTVIAVAEKRIAEIVSRTDGATNSGSLSFWTYAAGVGGQAGLVNSSKNWLFGTTGTSTARVHIIGSGTGSGTNSFLVQNSTPTNSFVIQDDLRSAFKGTTTANSTLTVSMFSATNGHKAVSHTTSTNTEFGYIGSNSGGSTGLFYNLLANYSGTNLVIFGNRQITFQSQINTTGEAFAFGFTNFSSYGTTSGTVAFVSAANNFAPTSGTAVYNAEVISGTINQTGGANGITRGLYINHTLTAAADYRALETTAGKIVFTDNNTLTNYRGIDHNVTLTPTTPGAIRMYNGQYTTNGSGTYGNFVGGMCQLCR